MSKFICLVVLSTFFISGCASNSSPELYVSDLDTNNFIVKINSDSRSDLTAYVNVTKVYDNCAHEWLGYIDLNDKTTKISLPENERFFVDVTLDRSTLGGSSSNEHKAFIVTRKGYKNIFYLEYINGLYDSEIYEENIKSKQKKRIREEAFKTCKSF